MLTYAKKVPTQKKEAHTASSVLDFSSQSDALQHKANMANNAVQRAEVLRPNNTGMPDNLKAGIESLSGFSMDDVRVHYNSSKPATVQALAYTKGTDIHVAPGQEKHLPHEAWHVAQQKAGRVSPTTNINGTPVNDKAALENEADVMGTMAIQCKSEEEECMSNSFQLKKSFPSCETSQLKLIQSEYDYFHYHSGSPQKFDGTFNCKVKVGTKMVATLKKGEDNFTGQEASANREQDDMMDDYRRKTKLKGNQLVKGHLLNAHLGGFANNENLFPITDGANSNHLQFVENIVKELVLNERHIYYSVIALPEDANWNTNCKYAKFVCHYETIDKPFSIQKPYIKDDRVIYSIIPNAPQKSDRGKATNARGGKLSKTEGSYKRGLNKLLAQYSKKGKRTQKDIQQLIRKQNKQQQIKEIQRILRTHQRQFKGTLSFRNKKTIARV